MHLSLVGRSLDLFCFPSGGRVGRNVESPHKPFGRLIDNPMFIVPRLSDLVILWLKDTIGEGHQIVFGEASGCGSGALMIDRKLVCYVYDDTVDIIINDAYQSTKIINAADPEFFPMLWKRMKVIDATIDPTWDNYITTFIEKK